MSVCLCVCMCVDHTMNQQYLGTWVAECTIHTAVGKYIRAFKV
jgi:hypothetical protein